MRKIATVLLLTPIPALCIGAVVMHQSGISPLIYGQNILCYLLLSLVVFFFGSRNISILGSRPVVLAFLIGVGAFQVLPLLTKTLTPDSHRANFLAPFRTFACTAIKLVFTEVASTLVQVHGMSRIQSLTYSAAGAIVQ